VAQALWFLAALLLPQAPVSALAHLPALAAGSGPVLALPGSMADVALKLDLAWLGLPARHAGSVANCQSASASDFQPVGSFLVLAGPESAMV
jgi:hypothetical protein